MPTEADDGKCPKRERGFVLVAVLWIAGLLAVLAAAFSLSVRTHVRIAANLTDSAAAEALADAGVTLAIMDLAAAAGDPATPPRIVPGADAFACAIAGEGSLAIQVRDEAARIDINSAGIPILQALLTGLNEPPDRALAVAETIFDYRDSDDNRKVNGAERPEYVAAGLAWGPKNAPFDSVEELGQVLGMTPALLARMRPHVNVHSGLAGVDAGQASSELMDMLRRGVAGISGTFGGFPDLDPDYALPAMFNTPAPRRVVMVRAVGTAQSGAVFAREAILDVGSIGSSAPRILRWQRGSLSAPGYKPLPSLPPC